MVVRKQSGNDDNHQSGTLFWLRPGNALSGQDFSHSYLTTRKNQSFTRKHSCEWYNLFVGLKR